MTEACDIHDGDALTRLGQLVCRQAAAFAKGSVEFEEARREREGLVATFNQKLAGLGRPLIDCATTAMGDGDAEDLKTGEAKLQEAVRAAIDDDRLCAHTRNTLTAVLSRLERTFDGAMRGPNEA